MVQPLSRLIAVKSRVLALQGWSEWGGRSMSFWDIGATLNDPVERLDLWRGDLRWLEKPLEQTNEIIRLSEFSAVKARELKVFFFLCSSIHIQWSWTLKRLDWCQLTPDEVKSAGPGNCSFISVIGHFLLTMSRPRSGKSFAMSVVFSSGSVSFFSLFISRAVSVGLLPLQLGLYPGIPLLFSTVALLSLSLLL